MNVEFCQQIKLWIIDNKPSVTAQDFDVNTPLIETGILDSMLIVDLILYIEFLTQKPTSIETIQPASFYSLARIDAAFNQPEVNLT